MFENIYFVNCICYAAIYSCAFRTLYWYIPYSKSLYSVLCFVLVLIFTLTIQIQSFFPFIFITLSASVTKKAEPETWVRIQGATTSITLVMLAVIAIQSCFTICIPDFNYWIYARYLISLCLISFFIIFHLLASKYKPPLLSGNAGIILALLEILLLCFYGFILKRLSIENMIRLAWINLFVIIFCVGVILLFNQLYKIQLRNVRLQHDSETLHETNLLMERFITFRHTYSKIYTDMQPLVDSNNWIDLKNYFQKNVTPAYIMLNQARPDLQQIQDTILRNSLEMTIAEIDATKAYTLAVSVHGCISIPQALCRPVYSLCQIFIENAIEYLDEHGGIFTITLYGEDDFTTIEISNTVQADFDENGLWANRPHDAKGNGMTVAKKIILANPRILHDTDILTSNSLPYQLTHRLMIFNDWRDAPK